MTYIRLRRVPAFLALVATAAALPVLMGCQPQTIIARVNDKPITEQEFTAAVQKVQQTSFTNQPQNMTAGAITLESLIQGILIDQCASAPSLKGTPSEDTVKAYFNQVQRKDPNMANELKDHVVDEEDVSKQIKTFLEMIAIGTDGAKPDDKELQAEYDKLNAAHGLDYPTFYTLRILVSDNRDAAATALQGLIKTGDFKAAADELHSSPEQAALIRPTIYTPDRLPPETLKPLDALTPNHYTTEPIEFTSHPNPNNPQASTPSTHYMIAQLIEKSPGSTPNLAAVRALISQMSLQEKYPQWKMHEAVKVGEFTEKSNIQIMVDKYKPLLNEVILPAAKRNAALANGESGGPGSAPGGMSTGGAAPPPSSGAR